METTSELPSSPNNSDEDQDQEERSKFLSEPVSTEQTTESQTESIPTSVKPIDQIIKIINGFGKYQITLIFILFITITSQTFFIVSTMYIYIMPHVQQICLDTLPEHEWPIFNSNFIKQESLQKDLYIYNLTERVCSQKKSKYIKNFNFINYTSSYWHNNHILLFPDYDSQDVNSVNFFDLFNIEQCSKENYEKLIKNTQNHQNSNKNSNKIQNSEITEETLSYSTYAANCKNDPCTHNIGSVFKGCLPSGILKQCKNKINIYSLRNNLVKNIKNAIIEFNFMCENQWKRDYCYYSGFIGIMFGTLVYGIISDTIGRKWTFLVGILCMYLNGIFLAIFASENILATLIFGFLVGTGANIAFYNSVVLVSEFVDSKHRSLAQIGSVLGIVCGNILAPWSTALLPYWREYNIIFWSSCLVSIPTVGYFFIEETPYWLLNNKRYKQLELACKKIYQTNFNAPMDKKLESQMLSAITQFQNENQEDETKNGTKKSPYVEILGNSSYVKNLLLLTTYWAFLNFGNYCMNMNISNLDGNMYRSVLNSITEI